MKQQKLAIAKCHKDFGVFIREARLQNGASQAEVAEILGITQSYWSRIESGERDIDLAEALFICRMLNVDIKDFIEQYMKNPVV